MTDNQNSTFNFFLKCYKLFLTSLLILSITMAIYFTFTDQLKDAAKMARSALIFAALLWVAVNLRWIEERIGP
ncbi:hypothetical protein CER19_27520 [Pseudomonas sp. GL93]|uniref:hypothetical protein n=1 Tax=Pseudomonas sp. GL93 TaxID=2014741 RepID=UPI000E313252|nr:hypothetical protein [Pseudomonas sp. GL93]RFD23985.1 hypothetical protein CER19_27520 [Pseudomonas sp. GL93]